MNMSSAESGELNNKSDDCIGNETIDNKDDKMKMNKSSD